MDVKRHYAQPVRAFELRQTSVLWAAKTRLQQIVTAVALNLVRLGAVYPASSDPASHFAALAPALVLK